MDKPVDDGVLEEFRVELREFWQWLPNKALFFILLAGWLALFQFYGHCTFGYLKAEYRSPSIYIWLYDAFGNGGNPLDSEEGTGVFVPLVVLGVFWWRRKELMKLRTEAWWPGLGLLLVGILVHVVGFRVQQPRVSVVGLFTGIYGLMGMAWGLAFLRASIFPFFLFIFCIPLSSLALPITFRLRMLVCQLVEALCGNLLAIDIIRSGTQLSDPSGSYAYEVAAACSGIKSLTTILLLTIVYGFMDFKSWWRRLAVIASAFPLAVLGNTCRMLLIILASEIKPSWGHYVHESTLISLTPYVPAIAGVMFLGHWLRERAPQPASVATNPQPTPA